MEIINQTKQSEMFHTLLTADSKNENVSKVIEVLANSTEEGLNVLDNTLYAQNHSNRFLRPCFYMIFETFEMVKVEKDLRILDVLLFASNVQPTATRQDVVNFLKTVNVPSIKFMRIAYVKYADEVRNTILQLRQWKQTHQN